MYPYYTIPARGCLPNLLLCVVASLSHACVQDSSLLYICLSVSSELRCPRGWSLSSALCQQHRAKGMSAIWHYSTDWERAVMSLCSPAQERGWQTRWAGGSRQGPCKLGTVSCGGSLWKDVNQGWSKVGLEISELMDNSYLTSKNLENKRHSWLFLSLYPYSWQLVDFFDSSKTGGMEVNAGQWRAEEWSRSGFKLPHSVCSIGNLLHSLALGFLFHKIKSITSIIQADCEDYMKMQVSGDSHNASFI